MIFFAHKIQKGHYLNSVVDRMSPSKIRHIRIERFLHFATFGPAHKAKYNL